MTQCQVPRARGKSEKWNWAQIVEMLGLFFSFVNYIFILGDAIKYSGSDGCIILNRWIVAAYAPLHSVLVLDDSWYCYFLVLRGWDRNNESWVLYWETACVKCIKVRLSQVPFSVAKPSQWASRHKSSIWTLFEPNRTSQETSVLTQLCPGKMATWRRSVL